MKEVKGDTNEVTKQVSRLRRMKAVANGKVIENGSGAAVKVRRTDGEADIRYG
jgi:hypothetical protein